MKALTVLPTIPRGDWVKLAVAAPTAAADRKRHGQAPGMVIATQ